MKKIRIILALGCACLLPALAAAQDARLYTPENGLPNTQVNRLYQDRRGFVWIGTEGGLLRFDGVGFETFRHDREKENTLTSSSVIDILEDSRGTKWVGTASGLDVFDSDYNSFSRYDFRDERIPDSNPYISRLLELPGRDGSSLLAATSGYGVYFIDPGTRALRGALRERP